jgi:hypothetical protein
VSRDEPHVLERLLRRGSGTNVVDMLVLAGALTADEGVRWRRAIERAREQVVWEAGPRLRADVIEALRAIPHPRWEWAVLLADALEAIEPGEAPSPEVPSEEPGQEGWTMWTSGAVRPAERPAAVLTIDGEHPLPADPIIRVLAPAADVRAGVRLTSVVLRERTTDVRWHRSAGEGASGITLADDVGTEYGAPTELEETATFGAAVPPSARELRITWGGGTSTCDPAARWLDS